MKKKILVYCFLQLAVCSLIAQQTDTVKAVVVVDTLINDSVSVKEISKKEGYPIPRKAFFLSLAFPGAGQVYNKSYWYFKLPIIYGGAAAGIYVLNFNKKNYSFYRDQYYARVNGLPTADPALAGAQTQSIKDQRDFYFKNLQLSYILFGVGYLLVAAEAYTTAHLAHFDVSNNLSLQLKPVFHTMPDGAGSTGAGLVLSW